MARVTQVDELLGVSRAASLLQISPDTVRRWHKKGLIHARAGVRGERLFSRSEIERVNSRHLAGEVSWQVLHAPMTQLRGIELFCGAGGLALGLHNSGIQSELLVDNDKDAIKTLKLNRPNWNSLCGSVTDLDLSDYAGRIDVLSGGFPCQAFSYAGEKRGFEDARGTLFYEFARLAEQVQPRIILGENVRGLLSHDDGRTLSTMVGILKDLGYRVRYRILKAQFMDVPQKRERLIILAVDKSIPEILFPVEKDYIISMRQALRNVPKSAGLEYGEKKKAIMQLVPEGGYWRDLPEDIQKDFMGASYYLGGGKTGMARRLAWDEPSLTLTCNPAQKQTERCHPSETRPLTVREYARIQCFPDEWEFAGSTNSQYRQIGNAVPVNLAYHVGLAIRAMLGKTARKAERPSALAPIEDHSAF